jgi:MFS family permease
VLALGFGLVGIDRFMIVTLFPVIAKELALGYGAIGLITGALSIAWGSAALFMGNVSDRIGRRPVLIGSLLVFSSLVGASGLATGLFSLIAVRIVMGLADGAFMPASIAATLAVSAEKRRGLNIGLQQMTGSLFGLGLAPLIVSMLIGVINWRWIFALFVLPGFFVAGLVASAIPRAEKGKTPVEVKPRDGLADYIAVVRSRNIRVLMALMLAWLTCLVSISAFLPSYLIDHLKLSFGQMGQVMSAIGFGGAFGTVLLLWMSDKFGRKLIMLLAAMVALVAIWLLSRCGADVPSCFACLFVAMGCITALLTLTVGPMCDRSVPPELAATASGVVIATGELFGGGFAPVIVGWVAQRFGIEHVLWTPLVALIFAVGIGTLFKEERLISPEQRPSSRKTGTRSGRSAADARNDRRPDQG